jgi:hypothetical protein
MIVTSPIQATVSIGNAHHRRRLMRAVSLKLQKWTGRTVGGGNGTLVSIVVLFSSLIALSVATSVAGTTVRTLLIVVLTLGAILLVGRSKPATPEQGSAVRVKVQKSLNTPLYREADQKQRINAATQLGVGSLVAGAMLALIVSVVLGYLVTTTTSLLK